jgi:phosphoglycolate phosphatase-like HAD superfamily hydrolase
MIMSKEKSNKKIVVFDFDGVICDSTNECMVTSWNTWEAWNGRSDFRYSVENFTTYEKVRFRALRPRVRGAGEYYVLNHLMQNNIVISTQADYEKEVIKSQHYFPEFKRIFFERRNNLRNLDLKRWLGLHEGYPDVVNLIRALNFSSNLYIATLKDGQSVRLILESYGVDVPAERFYDQSMISSKLEALKSIEIKEQCCRDDMIFIDDNVTHLIPPHNEGYPAVHAAWCGVLPEYLKLAEKSGITSIFECEDVSTFI